jgi:hypothetical protein
MREVATFACPALPNACGGGGTVQITTPGPLGRTPKEVNELMVQIVDEL